ncbi:hypothetical protein L249_8367 [Ophiocordyceps polyrhachis-furcata BCC 54312]|uniref:Uncharacterized protein n=1 Tax=Ophiocordyceps polyrhachis-furcata BCC 54312 TaxID=1330021 RepID=A0A367L1N3_9HYPO|nr:hypothetical protein L249_8367 [Ophiocordyceps polyrhachis-furcata BCC 54312]
MGYRAQGPLQFLPNKKGIHSHVGRDGPNEVICGAKGKEEGGEKEVEMDKELTNREGDHVIEKKKRNHKVRKADADYSSKYFSRYFKVPTCSTLTYLYKIGDLEEDLYVPYPAVSAVLRGVWVRIRPYL